MPSKYYHPDSDYHRKVLGVEPPKAFSHNVVDTPENPLSEQLTSLKPHSWHLEGNKLTGQTEMGQLVQYVPTDYICLGSDDKGMPIFKKIVV